MSLRDELDRQIRFEISAEPTAQAALLEGGAIDTDAGGLASALNAYCNALRSALFKLADEVEALRSS